MAIFLSLWLIGWLLTIGFMTASKKFMAEPYWWRALAVVILAGGGWPVILGGFLHKALLPDETIED